MNSFMGAATLIGLITLSMCKNIDVVVDYEDAIANYDVNVDLVHDEDNVVDLEISYPDGNSFHLNVDDFKTGNTAEVLDYYDDIEVGLVHNEERKVANDR